MLVHEAAEPADVALLEGGLRALAQVLDVVKAVDHRLVMRAAPRILVLQDARGRAREAGEEEEQAVLEREAGLLIDRERRGIDRAVFPEREAGQATEGGDVLVLLADGLAQQVDLDVAGLLGQLARVNQRAAVGVERAQERSGEAARGTEASAGGDVGKGGDLDLRLAEIELAQRLADDAMANRVDGLDVLDLGVLQVDAGGERLDDGDVDVFVDRRGDEEPLVLAIVRGEVGAAAAEGYAKRAANDDHWPEPA